MLSLNQQLRIRRMRHGDIPFAIRLTNLEGWGITESDFERIIRLDPTGSFVADLGKRRVGMATTTSYGSEVAWIGNVVVEELVRGRHIGQQLVQQAVVYLRASGIRKIALYCMWKNAPFYEKLGFIRDGRFLRLRRSTPSYKPRPEHNQRRGSSSSHLSRMLSVDKRTFGADRSKLLRYLLNDNRYGELYHSNDRSFLVVKTYHDISEFGPWVGTASFDSDDRNLIRRVTSEYRDKPIELSCLGSNRKVLNALQKQGFSVANVGYRMGYMRKLNIGNDRYNFLLGFLDKG